MLHWERIVIIGLLLLISGSPKPESEFNKSVSAAHGRDVLDRIEQRMRLSNSNLYAQQIRPADSKAATGSEDCWSAGVQLTALTAAARIDPARYLAKLQQYTSALDRFVCKINGIDGYDSGPLPHAPDRYYDDNAWIVLGMLEAFEITHDENDLNRAKLALCFSLSGEDKKLGGGIYWRENTRDKKNTCDVAPIIVAATRMYTFNHDPILLATAQRLYRWNRSTLLDARDGLYFDSINLQGSLDRTKWSYNTALMIRAGCVLFDATGNNQYLSDAESAATSAAIHWYKPESGAIGDQGRFAHLLVESFLELSARDHYSKWADIDHRALQFLWEHERDPNGFYPKRWDQPVTGPIATVELLNEASAARAYFRAAWP